VIDCRVNWDAGVDRDRLARLTQRKRQAGAFFPFRSRLGREMAEIERPCCPLSVLS
jgi:hypothetical protein